MGEAYLIKVVRLRNPSSHGVISTNEDDRIQPRGIHFLRDGMRIVVSYLNHGLTCFDTTSGDMLWNRKPREGYPFIGSSALSPDGSLLVVHNLEDGLDLHRLKKRGISSPTTFKLDDHGDKNYPVSVAFLHDGQGVISGAQAGNVCVWETTSGDQFQVLGHEEHITQVVAVYQSDTHSYIAAASYRPNQAPAIKLWQAKRPGKAHSSDPLREALLAFNEGRVNAHDSATILASFVMTGFVLTGFYFGLTTISKDTLFYYFHILLSCAKLCLVWAAGALHNVTASCWFALLRWQTFLTGQVRLWALDFLRIPVDSVSAISHQEL